MRKTFLFLVLFSIIFGNFVYSQNTKIDYEKFESKSKEEKFNEKEAKLLIKFVDAKSEKEKGEILTELGVTIVEKLFGSNINLDIIRKNPKKYLSLEIDTTRWGSYNIDLFEPEIDENASISTDTIGDEVLVYNDLVVHYLSGKARLMVAEVSYGKLLYFSALSHSKTCSLSEGLRNWKEEITLNIASYFPEAEKIRLTKKEGEEREREHLIDTIWEAVR